MCANHQKSQPGQGPGLSFVPVEPASESARWIWRAPGSWRLPWRRSCLPTRAHAAWLAGKCSILPQKKPEDGQLVVFQTVHLPPPLRFVLIRTYTDLSCVKNNPTPDKTSLLGTSLFQVLPRSRRLLCLQLTLNPAFQTLQNPGKS